MRPGHLRELFTTIERLIFAQCVAIARNVPASHNQRLCVLIEKSLCVLHCSFTNCSHLDPVHRGDYEALRASVDGSPVRSFPKMRDNQLWLDLRLRHAYMLSFRFEQLLSVSSAHACVALRVMIRGCITLGIQIHKCLHVHAMKA